MALRKDLYSNDGYAGTATPVGSHPRSEHMFVNCERKYADDKSLSDETIRDQAIYSKIIDDIIIKNNNEHNFRIVEYLGSKSLYCSHGNSCEQNHNYVEFEINSGCKGQEEKFLKIKQDEENTDFIDKVTKIKDSKFQNHAIKNKIKYEFVNDNIFSNRISVDLNSKKEKRYKSFVFRTIVFILSTVAFFCIMLIFSNFKGAENYTELSNGQNIYSRAIEFSKFSDENNDYVYSNDQLFYPGGHKIHSHEIHKFIFESNLGAERNKTVSVGLRANEKNNIKDQNYLSDLASKKYLSVNDAAKALSF